MNFQRLTAIRADEFGVVSDRLDIGFSSYCVLFRTDWSVCF